ncbi:unnamed protein product [Cunninghamella blakesleeana]
MGATQLNQNPLFFTIKTFPFSRSDQEVEALVRQRVAEELERSQQQQQQLYGELSKQNINHDQNSVALKTDIENLIQRIKRSPHKDIPTEIAERQEALVLCYKKNESRVLDCWQEVEQFKESVSKAQKHFVATHQ